MKSAGLTDAEINETFVSSTLRGVFFRRWAAYSLLMWAALWFAGSLKYELLVTGVFVAASLGSIWLAAWTHAKRVAREYQWARTAQGWIRRDKMTASHVEIPMRYEDVDSTRDKAA